jgi:hemolysin type calcium-binding protein
MSINSHFLSNQHRVLVTSDDGDNSITISRDLGGHLFANGVQIDDATVANTDLIRVNGGDGNDVITFVDTPGAPLPGAEIFGGDGNDTLTGGSGADQFVGGDGNDTLFGHAGNDTLIGGDGNDIVDGDQGADVGILGAGNDVFVWDNGDGSDQVFGGSGFDTMLFNGNTGALNEQFTLSAGDGDNHALFTRAQGTIVMDLHDVEQVTINPFAGNDTITINDLTGTGITDVNVNLGFDHVTDTLIINDDDDVQVVNNGNGNLTITGVSGAEIHITGFDLGTDHIVVDNHQVI